jgi:hypothetical protein
MTGMGRKLPFQVMNDRQELRSRIPKADGPLSARWRRQLGNDRVGWKTAKGLGLILQATSVH